MRKLGLIALALGATLGASPALAGPFILDGTDADDHGFASGGANFEGWLYNQRALENIASGSSLTRTQKVIVALGSDAGTQAGNAIESAVGLSATLSAAGWSVILLNGSEIDDFFGNIGAGFHLDDASVIYMDSSFNVSGGLDSTEQASIDANAMAINNFVGSGGGLFTHSQGYGWLSQLIPGLTPVFGGDQGISLTAAGHGAFPGLGDADLSAGPYHNIFQNVGTLPVLGVDDGGFLAGAAVILGGAGGSITNPDPIGVPEPTTWALMMAGFFGLGAALRRQRRGVPRVFAHSV